MLTPPRFQAYLAGLLATWARPVWMSRKARLIAWHLQHGYGRHKCLGRYASEITMRESLRALLRLGRWQRLSPLQLDEQGLYVRSLRVGIGVRAGMVSGRGTG